MKATEITFEAKRVTRQYENDTVSITIQITESEDVQTAFAMARAACEEALTTGRDAALAAKMKELMSTPNGRAAFDMFLKSQGK